MNGGEIVVIVMSVVWGLCFIVDAYFQNKRERR